jgi:type IV pilus assembly protein PilN
MIRINLLPSPKKQARAAGGGSSAGWFVVYAVVAAVTVIVCMIVYLGRKREFQELVARNAALEARIATLTAQSAQVDEVRAQLERSRELERVVGELQRARFGPTRLLIELSRILSAGGGPTIDAQRLEQLRRTNPLAGFNRAWDPRRLWLTAFDEEERHVRIRGVGKTHEDVAEFMRRLTLSESFAQVQLERTEQVEDADTHLQVIGFEVSATVRY